MLLIMLSGYVGKSLSKSPARTFDKSVATFPDIIKQSQVAMRSEARKAFARRLCLSFARAEREMAWTGKLPLCRFLFISNSGARHGSIFKKKKKWKAAWVCGNFVPLQKVSLSSLGKTAVKMAPGLSLILSNSRSDSGQTILIWFIADISVNTHTHAHTNTSAPFWSWDLSHPFYCRQTHTHAHTYTHLDDYRSKNNGNSVFTATSPWNLIKKCCKCSETFFRSHMDRWQGSNAWTRLEKKIEFQRRGYGP